MRPDTVDVLPSAAACAAAAEALHREIAAVYDALDAHLAAAAWEDGAALVPRLGALEAALRPLAEARRLATRDESALWAVVDALAVEMGTRREAALRLTSAARAATAARLADLHASRSRAARYRGASSDAALFASHRA
jgi:hypothetical protein